MSPLPVKLAKLRARHKSSLQQPRNSNSYLARKTTVPTVNQTASAAPQCTSQTNTYGINQTFPIMATSSCEGPTLLPPPALSAQWAETGQDSPFYNFYKRHSSQSMKNDRHHCCRQPGPAAGCHPSEPAVPRWSCRGNG
jgi:hypothetical protein